MLPARIPPRSQRTRSCTLSCSRRTQRCSACCSRHPQSHRPNSQTGVLRDPVRCSRVRVSCSRTRRAAGLRARPADVVLDQVARRDRRVPTNIDTRRSVVDHVAVDVSIRRTIPDLNSSTSGNVIDPVAVDLQHPQVLLRQNPCPSTGQKPTSCTPLLLITSPDVRLLQLHPVPIPTLRHRNRRIPYTFDVSRDVAALDIETIRNLSTTADRTLTKCRRRINELSGSRSREEEVDPAPVM